MRLKQETCVLNKVGCISFDKMLPSLYDQTFRMRRSGFLFDRKSGKEAQHENRTLYGAKKCGMV